MQLRFGGLLAITLALLCACGGKGGNTSQESLLQSTVDLFPPIEGDTETEGFSQQIDDLPTPGGADQATWDSLKMKLVLALAKAGVTKWSAKVPKGLANEVSDLEVVVEPDGSATFSWSYRNIADYNQDSEVSISDLTQIVLNYSASTNDGENDLAEQVVDGDGNGEVSGSDITPIVLYFGNTVNGYALQVRFPGNEEWANLQSVPFEVGVPPSGGGWLKFGFNLINPGDNASYRVVPYVGSPENDLGQPSAVVVFDDDALGKPQNVNATEGTIAGAIEISWSLMDGVALYRIISAETELGEYSLLGTSQLLGTNYLHGELGEGEQHWYKVQGVLLGGGTPFANPVRGSTMVRPGQVANLSVSEAQFYDHTYLQWDAAEGAAIYKILRSEVSGGPYDEIYAGAGTTFNDFSLTPGTPYYYTAVGNNDAGDGLPSTEVSGRAAIPDDPPNVVSVTPLVGAAGSASEFFASISGGVVDTYSWEFGGGATPNQTTDSTPTITFGAVGVYNASLTVANEFGQHSYPFTFDIGNPPNFTNVTPTIGDSGESVVFVPEFSGTVVSWDWDFNGAGTPGTSDLEEPEVVLGAGGEYQVSVRATNQYGNGTFNFSLTVLAPPAVPIGLSASDGTFTGRIRLSWVKPPLATGYEVFRDSQETPVAQLGDVNNWDDTSDEARDFSLHTYWIVATNPDGDSGFSDPDTGFIRLSPPQGFSASDGTLTDRVRLVWTKPAGATGYKVYRDNTTSAYATVGDIDTWDDTNLPDYASHVYWVSATNANPGESDLSQSDAGFLGINAPTGVSASEGTFTDRIRISWSKPSGATGYKVYRDGTGEGDVVSGELGDVDTWDDTSVDDHSSHTYYVRAFNALAQSPHSTSASGFLGIAAPSGVSASEGTFTDWIRIAWTKPSGATGYKVYRDGTTEGDVVSGELGDVDTWDDTSVNDYSSHTYYVRAFNALTQSSLSSAASGFRGLAAPVGFAASDAGFTDRIRLTWSVVTGADDYKIYRDNETNLVHTTGSGDGSTVQWDDTSISDFETYDYWIKAFNPNGDGPASQDSGFIAFSDSWDTHAIDSSGVVGNWTSLQIIDGKPAVSYFDTQGGIKYARATTASPTQSSDWVYHTVDGLPLSGGDNLGNLGADLAELNGKPIIAYHNAFTGDLQIAKADIATPSSDSDWTVYVLDATDDVGTYPKILVIDGYAAVCYRDHTAGNIKFAMAKEQDPLDGSATYWDVYTLDNSANLGFEGIDLVLVGGKPAAAYFDLTNGDLKYAVASVARPSGAGQWSISQVASTNVVGKRPSLAVADGKPVVSYYDLTNTNLLYARATVESPSGTSDWVAMDLDTDGDCGNFGTSLLIVGGRPSVAYFRDGTQDLRYSSAFSAAPSAPADWYMVEIDTSASTGYYPSQIMLNGVPALTYRGGDFLMFAAPPG